LEARVVAMNHCIDGMEMATRIAPIVMTTSNSINVKPRKRIATPPVINSIGMLGTKPAHTAQRNLFRDERAHTSRAPPCLWDHAGIGQRERRISIDRRFTRYRRHALIRPH
jgi:hypothetical protein